MQLNEKIVVGRNKFNLSEVIFVDELGLMLIDILEVCIEKVVSFGVLFIFCLL